MFIRTPTIRARKIRSAVHARNAGMIATAAAAMLLVGPRVQGQIDTIVSGGYHAQVTNYFCAAASAEMALDVPAVRNNNADVNNLINAGDGPTLAAGSPYPTASIQIVNGVGTVGAGGAQAFIYGLNHGLNTVNGVGYYNPFSPPGTGTDSQGLDAGLNLLDNPRVNGAANANYAFGSHGYAGYNLANQALANRTIADALSLYSVPAVVAINSGGHAICVYGVQTDGPVVPNQNYQVTGVYVHDPWTGWAVAQTNAGNFDPALVNNNGGLGLGYSTYLRYGVDNVGQGPFTLLPNGQLAQVTLAPWTRIFNVAPPQLTPNGAFLSPGYKIEVEPPSTVGPGPIDTGDPAGDYGFPNIPVDLASPLTTGSSADTSALTDLSADTTLKGKVESAGGSFDTTDALFIQPIGDTGKEGDWLIPYDGAGGVNDVTSAVLIDAITGVIDEATWVNAGETPYTLLQIDSMMTDQLKGDLPTDNTVPAPEPATLAMAVAFLPMLLLRRRARAG